MFRIARSLADSPLTFASFDSQAADNLFLQQYCASDHWFGDLESGMFRMGKTGMQYHGLASEDCGLLTLLRTYVQEDRVHILQILERASSTPSKFCFATHVRREAGHLQPVICMGESQGFSDTSAGNLMGLFLFPRFTVPHAEPA